MSRGTDPKAAIKPNVNEALFLKRDLPADHPDVLAHKRFRGINLWPDDLPGFRETVVAYCDALEALAKKLMPLFAVALDLPADYFEGVRRTTIHAADDALSVRRGSRRKRVRYRAAQRYELLDPAGAEQGT